MNKSILLVAAILMLSACENPRPEPTVEYAYLDTFDVGEPMPDYLVLQFPHRAARQKFRCQAVVLITNLRSTIWELETCGRVEWVETGDEEVKRLIRGWTIIGDHHTVLAVGSQKRGRYAGVQQE